MTLGDFVVKYFGKKVDFDGAFGAQCVDLARQYFLDVWALPKQPEPVEGAKDFYYRHENRPRQKEMCECIAYRQGMVPPEGAVVIFADSKTNQYGHIGICMLAGEEDGIILFEQDGFAQNGAKIARWDYRRVVGWLLKKKEA